jgi:multimeric flavodoxin WrbA
MSLPSISYNNKSSRISDSSREKKILKAKKNKGNQARYIVVREYNISPSINITTARLSGGTSQEISHNTIRR